MCIHLLLESNGHCSSCCCLLPLLHVVLCSLVYMYRGSTYYYEGQKHRAQLCHLLLAISYSVAWIALALRFSEVTSDIIGNTDTSRSYTIHTIRAPYRHRPAPSRRAPATSESAIWLSDSVGLPGWPAAPSSPSLRRNCLHQGQCGGADTFLRGGTIFRVALSTVQPGQRPQPKRRNLGSAVADTGRWKPTLAGECQHKNILTGQWRS